MVLPSVQGDLEVNHQDPEWAHWPSWSHSGGKVPNSQCSKQVEQHILHARTSLWVQRSTVLNFPPSLNAYQFPLVLGFQWVGRLSWYDLPSPSPPTSGCLRPHLPLLPPLCSNSKAYLHNSYNCIVPTLGLTADQYWTHLGLIPMPRAAIYIPFLHLSYLPDPFSLTIMGNYSFLV